MVPPRMIFDSSIDTFSDQNQDCGHQEAQDQEIELHFSGLAGVHVI
jgi:hypothetical protein